MFLQGQKHSGFKAGLTAVLHAVVFVGTRPEAIKLAPLILALRGCDFCHVTVVASGQQPELCSDALSCFGLEPDFLLFQATSKAARCPSELSEAATAYLDLAKPDLVIVQGDTTTALAAAQAAYTGGVPVGHVEAGLRTHVDNRPFPEEPNRIAIAGITTLHFAPSDIAVHNLQNEGVPGTIVKTGNTGIDAMQMMIDRVPDAHTPPNILLTCHRRENFGDAVTEIAEAAVSLARTGYQITVPLHSNPAVATPLRQCLRSQPNIQLIAPLPYPGMIAMLRSVRLVITDSGGLQEECAALGTPLILMRDETERPEVVASGNCILVQSERRSIVDAASHCLSNPAVYARMSQPSWPYGTGDASPKIVDAIRKWWTTQQLQPQSSLALTA